jgi:methylphosphotriester-DNA--protein-cysteine methyltransferase
MALDLIRTQSEDWSVSTDWSGDGIRIRMARGTFRPAGWSALGMETGWAFVLGRRGAYRRRADGVEYVVDANTGFVRRPGEEWSWSSFTNALEEVTIVELEPPALEVLPDLGASAGPFTVDPPRAVAHRLLLHDLRADDLAIELGALDLVHQCLAEPDGYRGSGRRRSTASARARLVGDCIELLHTSFNEQLGLLDLARRVGASPYHLSRVFREVAGITLSQYRTRLRVHAVFDRLDGGDVDLAGIAADTGFSDHGHMTRTVTALLGARPSELRARLQARSPGIGAPRQIHLTDTPG